MKNIELYLNDEVELNELAEAAGGELLLHTPTKINGIFTDSRCVRRGSLFVAIRGERFDGHNYIAQAFEAGAGCVLAEKLPPPQARCGNIILVDSTIDALGRIAAAHKRAVNPMTVAITGSVGKTTTKEFVYSVLSEKFSTHKTDGNYNNEIGLPLTIFGLNRTHEAAVFELGMSKRGEIEHLSHIAQPDIAVITNIGTSHIENLGSRENICLAKLEIREGLKAGGKLILSGDEPLLAGNNAVYVSIRNPRSDYRAVNIREGLSGTVFALACPGGRLIDELDIPVVGMHNVFNAALAATVGVMLGLSDDMIRRGLHKFKNTGMRQHIYMKNGFTIIEDCYNANPESMRAVLSVLAKLCRDSREEGRSCRAIAVLGEMRELGSYAVELHKKVGEAAAQNRIDRLYTFGALAENIAAGARAAGMSADSIVSFDSLAEPDKLAEQLKNDCMDGDIILFKASRAVELERVITGFSGSEEGSDN